MNIYKDVESLQRSPVETGGVCSLIFFKIEDVQTWPDINPLTGIVSSNVQLKPGKSFFLAEAADKGRSYDEETKSDNSGPYIETDVQAMIAGGHNTANLLSLDTMKYHQWGVIIKDRAGFYRLIGSKDAGARFTYQYASGDIGSSRKANIRWSWRSSISAPVYNSTLFKITIGTVTVTTGKLTFIDRFVVGAPGAPMDASDTTLTNGAFANKNILVLADGTALPIDDGTGAIDWGSLIARHIEKTLISSTMTFVGGVNTGEIIEAYAFE